MIAAIATIFIIAFLVQIFFYLYFYTRLIFHAVVPTADNPIEPVSVIICAKNEATNLHKNLPTILGQKYFDFEVIVVNDGSSDNSEVILKQLQEKYQNLRVIHIEKGKGKKNAMEAGIAAAKNEGMIFTDADCQPATNNWLHELMSGFHRHQIVLGFSPYYRKRSMLNKFIRFETAHTATQYMSFALAGIPFMGVGRNLAYTKNVFRYSNGFTHHQHLLSGDDDLLVNKAAAGFKTGISMSPSSFVFSQPKESWKEWYRQKYRHFSTGTSYKWYHLLLLGLMNSSHLLFYISFLVLMILVTNPFWIILLFVIRLILQWGIFSLTFKKFGEDDLINFLPLFDFIYTFYLLIFTPAVFFNKNAQWQ